MAIQDQGEKITGRKSQYTMKCFRREKQLLECVKRVCPNPVTRGKPNNSLTCAKGLSYLF